jgi:hypothetical protein
MFRVSIRGKFNGLSEADRTTLARGADPLGVSFTPEGSFSCDASLAVFTFRCEVPAEADTDGEKEATDRAMARLETYGYPVTVLKVAVTDLREIKIRRKA